MRDSRWLLPLVVVFLAAFVAAGAIAGAEFMVPIVILACLVLAFLMFHLANTGRIRRRNGGSVEAAMADEDDATPSTPDIPDERTPLGATSEQHTDLDPHDLPPGHPSRPEVEARTER